MSLDALKRFLESKGADARLIARFMKLTNPDFVKTLVCPACFANLYRAAATAAQNNPADLTNKVCDACKNNIEDYING
jgi:hypothetical protein